MRLGLLPARRAGALGPPQAAGTTRRPPARRGRRGERPLLPLAPPLPLPGPRLARAGGGASTLAAAGLFPLVAAGGASPEAVGGGGGGGGGYSGGPGLRRGPRLGLSGAWPGSHASPGPGPAGGLPARLGGAAAGLPEHPGECRCGRPVALSRGSWLEVKGRAAAGQVVGGSGSRVVGPGVAPEGGEAPGPGGPSRDPPFGLGCVSGAAPTAATPAQTRGAWRTWGLRGGPGRRP